MSEYYNWQKTLSYDAPITMVMTARGRGKTFGLRKQAFADFLNNGERFVEICRFKDELGGVEEGYFDKLQTNIPEMRGYAFKIEKHRAYAAKLPPDYDPAAEKRPKLEWAQCGYFVALSTFQNLKKWTFAKVRRIIYDEAVMEKTDRFHDYLPNEWYALSSIFDTIARQQPGEETRARLYCLGNSCDLMNPIFQNFKIWREPRAGYSWHGGKLLLLHYEQNSEYAEAKAAETIAGKMLSMTSAGRAMITNDFQNSDDSFIASKTSGASFDFGLKFEKQSYAVWLDAAEGYYYVNRKIPKNTNSRPVYAMTLRDHRPNYILAKRNSKLFRNFVDLMRLGIVMFDTQATRAGFQKVLALFGARM